MKRRVWLLVVLLGIAALGGGGYWFYYELTHREVDVAELGVEEDFFDFSSVMQLPPISGGSTSEGSSDSGSAAGTEANRGENVAKGETNAQRRNSTAQTDESENARNAPLSPREKEELIYNKYYRAFSQLQNLAESRLDTLFRKAKEEYIQKKDQEGFSNREFAAKYMSAAKKMQAEVDKVFYQLLDQMKAELKEENLSLSLADKAEQAYKQRIAEKKAELMEAIF